MATRARWMAALGLVACFSACAQGSVNGPGGTGGATTTTSGPGGATTASTTTASSTGTGGTGGTGGVATASSVSTVASTGGPNLCGNGMLDPGEQCDGSNFGGATCVSEGFAGGGTLSCDQFCNIDVSGCTMPENCTNDVDDNGNCLIDCQDPSCFGMPGCVDSCLPTTASFIGDMPEGDTTGRPAVHHASCSDTPSGNEQIYAVTATMTGSMSVDLQFGDANFSLSVRTSCEMDSSEIGCTTMPNDSFFGDVALVVPVTMGQTYYIMIQGVTPADFGFFDLDFENVLPETDCTDLVDNDGNGYTDCDDPACQTTAACVPGTTATGLPCKANTDCTANHDDPICLNSDAWPNGYCSEFCDVTTQDCSAGNICYPNLMIDGQLLSKDGVCLHDCTQDTDCAPNYGCTDVGLSSNVCELVEIACNDHLDNDFDDLIDCQDPTNCQKLPACTPGTNAVGQPCTQHNDCFSSQPNPFCFDAANEGFTNGYCSHFCDPTVANVCGATGICTDQNPLSTNMCMATCTTNSQCRVADGYSCQNVGLAKMICTF